MRRYSSVIPARESEFEEHAMSMQCVAVAALVEGREREDPVR